MEKSQDPRQGGAVPRSLPAGSLRAPGPLRAGFALLGAGALADLPYHATNGWASAPHASGAATAIHLLVLAGMVSTLAGLFVAAPIDPPDPSGRKENTVILAAAPQVLDHPCCDFINSFPWGFFLAVHIVLFAAGAYFASRALAADQGLFGAGFALFAVAELFYLTYHINVTQFLFAHTASEVLDALAFVALFAGAARASLVTWSSAPAERVRVPR